MISDHCPFDGMTRLFLARTRFGSCSQTRSHVTKRLSSCLILDWLSLRVLFSWTPVEQDDGDVLNKTFVQQPSA
jgi:hypothetical protein